MNKKNIFPKAVDPPKLVKPYGVYLGWAATVITVVFAVVHLFRIDTLIPLVDKVLPGATGLAIAFVIVVILAEVFAIPFLTRMKLSPLAHLASGAVVVLGPLLWTLLTIWSFGLPGPTGQFGQFIPAEPNIFLLALNFVWLALNFTSIWALGYNNLKVKELLKK